MEDEQDNMIIESAIPLELSDDLNALDPGQARDDAASSKSSTPASRSFKSSR